MIPELNLGVPSHNYQRFYSLKKDDVYVEIGAFVGRTAQIAARKECAKIVAIEPMPANITELKKLAALYPNITVVEKAIYNTKCTLEMRLNSDKNTNAAKLNHDKYAPMYDLDNFPGFIVPVEVDRIDNILKGLEIENVDLLTGDCEGAEVYVIETLGDYLKAKKIKNIALASYHLKDAVYEKIMKPLQTAGYNNITYVDGIVYAKA